MCKHEFTVYSVCAHTEPVVVQCANPAACKAGRKPTASARGKFPANLSLRACVGWCPGCVTHYKAIVVTPNRAAENYWDATRAVSNYWAYKAVMGMDHAVPSADVPARALDSDEAFVLQGHAGDAGQLGELRAEERAIARALCAAVGSTGDPNAPPPPAKPTTAARGGWFFGKGNGKGKAAAAAADVDSALLARCPFDARALARELRAATVVWARGQTAENDPRVVLAKRSGRMYSPTISEAGSSRRGGGAIADDGLARPLDVAKVAGYIRVVAGKPLRTNFVPDKTEPYVMLYLEPCVPRTTVPEPLHPQPVPPEVVTAPHRMEAMVMEISPPDSPRRTRWPVRPDDDDDDDDENYDDDDDEEEVKVTPRRRKNRLRIVPPKPFGSAYVLNRSESPNNIFSQIPLQQQQQQQRDYVPNRPEAPNNLFSQIPLQQQPDYVSHRPGPPNNFFSQYGRRWQRDYVPDRPEAPNNFFSQYGQQQQQQQQQRDNVPSRPEAPSVESPQQQRAPNWVGGWPNRGGNDTEVPTFGSRLYDPTEGDRRRWGTVEYTGPPSDELHFTLPRTTYSPDFGSTSAAASPSPSPPPPHPPTPYYPPRTHHPVYGHHHQAALHLPSLDGPQQQQRFPNPAAAPRPPKRLPTFVIGDDSDDDLDDDDDSATWSPVPPSLRIPPPISPLQLPSPALPVRARPPGPSRIQRAAPVVSSAWAGLHKAPFPPLAAASGPVAVVAPSLLPHPAALDEVALGPPTLPPTPASALGRGSPVRDRQEASAAVQAACYCRRRWTMAVAADENGDSSRSSSSSGSGGGLRRGTWACSEDEPDESGAANMCEPCKARWDAKESFGTYWI